MKKSILITLIAATIAILIIAIVISINKAKQFSPSPSDLVECKTLYDNGENKINLVLFTNQKTAKEYADFFYTIEPFNQNKESFNFYYIDSYSPECEIYKDIAILCYNKNTIKKAASCPNDYIIVIQDKPSNIRSSAYMNVMSLNSKHQKTVFPHEFGHAFVNLAEEYVPAKIPSGSENCQQSCNNFNIKDSCDLGCSDSNFYRSVKNGIMRTLSSTNYGSFNKQLILNKISSSTGSSITGFAIQEPTECSESKYYLIEGQYNQGTKEIDIVQKSIDSGCVGENGAGAFEYNLILKDQSTAETGEFNPELIFTDQQEESQEQIQGQTYDSDRTFILKVPIIPNAKSLEITKENIPITSIDLEDMGIRPCKK